MVEEMASIGVGQTVYTPSQVTAQNGDIIEFEFHPKNHTVTQSSFAQVRESTTSLR